jgi:hypothetical protein
MNAPEDDQVLVSGLTPAELVYLRFSEKRQERISRSMLTARVAAVQGESLKQLRESGTELHIRAQLDDDRGLTITAVSDSMRVTKDGLEAVRQP